MAKTKTPFLSLGSQGTVGGVLTSQKRGGDTILRRTPRPTDPYSLRQAYQRWDYRDYAYLWTLLSNSEKQIYRTRGSRYHITGFSQYMREQLKTLPDLLGRWHLDELSGATAYDSSKQTNNGTIIGASPTTGRIAGAYYFDGLNDKVLLPSLPLFDLPAQATIEFFYTFQESVPAITNYYIFQYGRTNQYGWEIRVELGDTLRFLTSQAAAVQASRSNVIPLGTHHYAITRDDAVVTFFQDAQDITAVHGVHIQPAPSLTPPKFASNHDDSQWGKGILDHFVYYNRVCDLTEIKRHSERRYPL